jgi:hypothetical protein
MLLLLMLVVERRGHGRVTRGWCKDFGPDDTLLRKLLSEHVEQLAGLLLRLWLSLWGRLLLLVMKVKV